MTVTTFVCVDVCVCAAVRLHNASPGRGARESGRRGWSRLGTCAGRGLPTQTFPRSSSASAAAAATCAREHGRKRWSYHPSSKLRLSQGGSAPSGWVMTSAKTPRAPAVPSRTSFPACSPLRKSVGRSQIPSAWGCHQEHVLPGGAAACTRGVGKRRASSVRANSVCACVCQYCVGECANLFMRVSVCTCRTLLLSGMVDRCPAHQQRSYTASCSQLQLVLPVIPCMDSCRTSRTWAFRGIYITESLVATTRFNTKIPQRLETSTSQTSKIPQ